MNKTLFTIQDDSVNEMGKKIAQAQALSQLMLVVTCNVKGSIENELINNSMWLLSDLLDDTAKELKKREYLKGGQDE